MNEIEKIVDKIAETAITAGGQVLFRRVVRKHLQDIRALRGRCLTWEQIAQKLTQRGVRHKRGQTISGHQMRTEFNRLEKSGMKVRLPLKDTTLPFASDRRQEYQKSSKSLGYDLSNRTGNSIEALLKTRTTQIEFDD